MKELFLEYEDALALKELGFDEPCFGYFNPDEELVYGIDIKTMEYVLKYHKEDESVLAPLYQQAFKFFREKYQLHPEIIVQLGFEHWNAHILPHGMWLKPTTPTGFETYEEAEKAAIKQLIKLAKNEL